MGIQYSHALHEVFKQILNFRHKKMPSGELVVDWVRRPDSNFHINQLNYKKLTIHVWLMYTQLYTQLFFTSKPDSNESTKSREALQPNAIVPSQTKKA